MKKFTPEIRTAILKGISAGLSQRDACRAAGISLPTLRTWISRGNKGDSGYAEFVEALASARDQAAEQIEPMDEEELLRVVSEAARRGSVQAMKLRWEMICERRKPTEEPEQADDPFTGIDELSARRAA